MNHTCTNTATLAFGLPPPCEACLADPVKFTPQSVLDEHNQKPAPVAEAQERVTHIQAAVLI